MSTMEMFFVGWFIVALAMVVLWLIQLRTGDAGIVDVAWTGGLGFLAIFFAVGFDGGVAARRWLIAALVAIWATRLLVYLLRDRILSGEEDGRYQTLRERWGDRAQRNLFIFFQVQAALAAVLALHFLLAMSSGRPLGVLDLIGAAVWAISIIGESTADRQLERFRSNPANRGRTCRDGLWRYSRHPNYFFEWIHWLAYIPIAWGAALWPAAFLAPAVMLYFMTRVTGIPATEEQALKSRGDDYRLYQQETSAFFPWFPKGKGR
jgi:steroid 5-alpha reductase family enzyme